MTEKAKTETEKQSQKATQTAQRNYPGAGYDASENEEVTDKMVREAVRRENNNPRNDS